MKGIRLCSMLALLVLQMAVCFEAAAEAQDRVVISSLQSLQTRLTGSDTDRTLLAHGLKLTIPKWTRWGATENIPCTVFSSVQSNTVNLVHTGGQAVVVIYSSNCAYTYLVVFQRTPQGSWSHVDTMPIWSKYNEPKISFESLIDDGIKEIVAAGCTVDTGTGVAQTDLIVFKLFPNGLQVILDAPEHVVYAVTPSPKTEHAVNQDQESTFSFIPHVEEEGTSSKQPLERRTIQDRTTTLTQWWLYIWIPEMRTFRAVRTSERMAGHQ
jgi:hypothetical protein